MSMVADRPQAISGVSATRENVVMEVYPSIAATGLGRVIGLINDCIPVRIGAVSISNVLFGLPTAPLALLVYAYQKVAGVKYVLTNRSVQVWATIGSRMVEQVGLSEIDSIELDQKGGQAYFKAADIVIRGADGKVRYRLQGVTRANVFRETILKTRDARRNVEASLATIEAR